MDLVADSHDSRAIETADRPLTAYYSEPIFEPHLIGLLISDERVVELVVTVDCVAT